MDSELVLYRELSDVPELELVMDDESVDDLRRAVMDLVSREVRLFEPLMIFVLVCCLKSEDKNQTTLLLLLRVLKPHLAHKQCKALLRWYINTRHLFLTTVFVQSVLPRSAFGSSFSSRHKQTRSQQRQSRDLQRQPT